MAVACDSGTSPSSIVAIIVNKCEHTKGLKILKSISHRSVFSEVFYQLHPKSPSESTWTAEVNGFEVENPSVISLGDLIHVLTPPLTITYICTTQTETLETGAQFTGSNFFVQKRSFWKSICIYCPFNMSKQLFIKIGPFAVNSKRIVPMYFQWDCLRIDARFTILKHKSPVIIFK